MSCKYDACHLIPQLTLALLIYANGEILTACSGNLVCTHLIHHFTTNQRNIAVMPWLSNITLPTYSAHLLGSVSIISTRAITSTSFAAETCKWVQKKTIS